MYMDIEEIGWNGKYYHQKLFLQIKFSKIETCNFYDWDCQWFFSFLWYPLYISYEYCIIIPGPERGNLLAVFTNVAWVLHSLHMLSSRNVNIQGQQDESFGVSQRQDSELWRDEDQFSPGAAHHHRLSPYRTGPAQSLQQHPEEVRGNDKQCTSCSQLNWG